MSSEVFVEIFFKQQTEKDKLLAKLNIISNDVAAAIKSQVANLTNNSTEKFDVGDIFSRIRDIEVNMENERVGLSNTHDEIASSLWGYQLTLKTLKS